MQTPIPHAPYASAADSRRLGSWKRNIRAALRALQREREQLEQDLAEIDGRIDRLEALARSKDLASRGARRLSPQGREAISKAAKARWAEYRRLKAAGLSPAKRKGARKS